MCFYVFVCVCFVCFSLLCLYFHLLFLCVSHTCMTGDYIFLHPKKTSKKGFFQPFLAVFFGRLFLVFVTNANPCFFLFFLFFLLWKESCFLLCFSFSFVNFLCETIGKSGIFWSCFFLLFWLFFVLHAIGTKSVVRVCFCCFVCFVYRVFFDWFCCLFFDWFCFVSRIKLFRFCLFVLMFFDGKKSPVLGVFHTRCDRD